MAMSRTFKVLPLIPEDMSLVYSNHALVQTTGPEVVLSFLQVAPPHVESEADFDALPALPAKCIGRILLTREKAEALHDALGEVLGRRRKG